TATFTATASWESYDLSNLDIGCEGYFGGVFDGKYVNFIPLRHQSNQTNGLVVRFDTTTSSFTTTASWSVYDTKAVSSAAAGYIGGAFDGKNLYLTPYQGGDAARYDTSMSFTATGSWKAFSTATVSAQVATMEFGGFDGRYIYLGPSNGTTIAQVDTTAQ